MRRGKAVSLLIALGVLVGVIGCHSPTQEELFQTAMSATGQLLAADISQVSDYMAANGYAFPASAPDLANYVETLIAAFKAAQAAPSEDGSVKAAVKMVKTPGGNGEDLLKAFGAGWTR